MKFSPWVLLMLGNHCVPMVSPGNFDFDFFKAKKVPNMGFFVDGDPKIFLKNQQTFSNYFAPRFLPAISKFQKYVGNETP